MAIILDPVDAPWVAAAILFLGFWGYTKNGEGGGWKVGLVSLGNALLHWWVLRHLSEKFAALNTEWFGGALRPRWPFVAFAAEMICIGGVIAGFLFGIYLYVTSRFADMNHNDAFSSMRRDSHRQFLRLRIKDDEVMVYPIALDDVPSRRDWRFNDKDASSLSPIYVPTKPLAPHLIEPPIVIATAPGA